MLIINLSDNEKKKCYKCKQKKSYALQCAGFQVYGMDDEFYYFRYTEQLKNFLKHNKGGDMSE